MIKRKSYAELLIKKGMVLPTQTQTEMKVKLVLAMEAIQAGKEKSGKMLIKKSAWLCGACGGCYFFLASLKCSLLRCGHMLFSSDLLLRRLRLSALAMAIFSALHVEHLWRTDGFVRQMRTQLQTSTTKHGRSLTGTNYPTPLSQ